MDKDLKQNNSESTPTDKLSARRHIKSFVLRQGKITQGQKNALENLMPRFGIKYTENNVLNFQEAFGNSHPVIIEIGFGMGYSTWQMAVQNPRNNYLGIEVHSPGVGTLLMSLKEYNVNNVKIIHHDALEVLTNMIPNGCIHGFHIFFPDPWHKKRHHKRRIIQQEFVNLLIQKLSTSGYIHLATDWEDYANQMLEILQKNPLISNLSNTNLFATVEEAKRPTTKFEQRGISLGHGVWDLLFAKL